MIATKPAKISVLIFVFCPYKGEPNICVVWVSGLSGFAERMPLLPSTPYEFKSSTVLLLGVGVLRASMYVVQLLLLRTS